MMKKVQKTEEQWREELSPEQFHILREKGTERPGTGKYVEFNETGDYVCAACGNVLFESGTKFDAGCGWPSFYDIANSDAVDLHPDTSFGMVRTEVTCKQCGGHLGHVFDDGPRPTGQRYCINSLSLKFKPKK